MQQKPALSKFACLCASILNTNEHPQVNIFTPSSLLNQSLRQRLIHVSFCSVQTNVNAVESKATATIYLAYSFAEKSPAGQTHSQRLWGYFKESRWTVVRLVMENFSSGLRWGWECVRSHHVTFSWSRWAAIGPEPNPQTLNPPPPRHPAALSAAWPLHLWAECRDEMCVCR